MKKYITVDKSYSILYKQNAAVVDRFPLVPGKKNSSKFTNLETTKTRKPFPTQCLRPNCKYCTQSPVFQISPDIELPKLLMDRIHTCIRNIICHAQEGFLQNDRSVLFGHNNPIYSRCCQRNHKPYALKIYSI